MPSETPSDGIVPPIRAKTARYGLTFPRRSAVLTLSLLQVDLRVKVGKMPVKLESDRPRPLLLQPAS